MTEEEKALRDMFAAVALHAIVSKTPVFRTDEDDNTRTDEVVRGAYSYADSMMREREKRDEE